MPYYTRPEELLDHFNNLFESHKEQLGLAYVATQDENLIPEFPAVEIVMGPVSRRVHGTHRFYVIFEATFWIYHANYEETHAQRNRTDMELATHVVEFLHLPANRRLELDTNYGLITGSGFVRQEVPGFIVADRNRVVATRLSWLGEVIVNYEDS